MAKGLNVLQFAAALVLIGATSIDAFVGSRATHTECRSPSRQDSRLFSLAQLIDEPLAWNAVIGEADRTAVFFGITFFLTNVQYRRKATAEGCWNTALV